MTNETPAGVRPLNRPRTPLLPNPALRHGHLDPIKCSCGSEAGCAVPHGSWLIQGGKAPR